VVNGGQEKVLASKNNTFEINLKNYNPADPNIVTTWFIVPNITEQQSNLKLSDNNQTFSVKKGGFEFNTDYTLTVSI